MGVAQDVGHNKGIGGDMEGHEGRWGTQTRTRWGQVETPGGSARGAPELHGDGGWGR